MNSQLDLLSVRPRQHAFVSCGRDSKRVLSVVVQILVGGCVRTSTLTDPMSDCIQSFHIQRLPLKRQSRNLALAKSKPRSIILSTSLIDVLRHTNKPITRCCPNGTWHDWPAVQCRPPDRPRVQRPAHPLARRQCYRRRRQTPATVTSLAPRTLL